MPNQLKDYLILIFKRLGLILGLVGFFSLLLIVVLLLIPDKYAAKTNLVLSQENYNLEFADAENFESGTNIATYALSSTYYAVLGIAESPYILSLVLDNLEPPLSPELNNLYTFSQMTEAQLINNNSIIQLTVQASSPERAVQIANTWAQILENHVNELYNLNNIDQSDLETELEASLLIRATDETAVLNFREHDQRILLGLDLDTLRLEYRHNQERIFELNELEESLNNFSIYLSNLDANAPSHLGDELLLINFQFQIFSPVATPQDLVDLQITDFNLNDTNTNSILIGHVNTLKSFLSIQRDSIQARQTLLAEQDQILQLAIDELNIEYEYIIGERNLSLETTELLASKLVELRIESLIPATIIRIATPAVQDNSSVGFSRGLIAILGILSIIILVTSFIFLYEYWLVEIKPHLGQTRG